MPMRRSVSSRTRHLIDIISFSSVLPPGDIPISPNIVCAPHLDIRPGRHQAALCSGSSGCLLHLVSTAFAAVEIQSSPDMNSLSPDISHCWTVNSSLLPVYS